jgi:hypothetical protein
VFGFELISGSTNAHYEKESYRAAALLIESHSSEKLFVTNIHPNYQLLGCNFLKTTEVVPYYEKPLAIVVYSAV